jgi:DNA-binding Lrp family transcriptional regulator
MSNLKQNRVFTRAKELKLETPMQKKAEPVSIVEAAKSLNVSQRTVWNYIRKGRLDKVTIGHKAFVSLESLENLSRSATQSSVLDKAKQIKTRDELSASSSDKAVARVTNLEGLTGVREAAVENQHLLESQTEQKNEKNELAEAQARLSELESKESELRSRSVSLETENKYIWTILWILIGLGLGLLIGTLVILIK